MDLVWNFMTEVYAPDYANGAPAPFFEYALSSTWMDKTYLHLDRLWLDGDKVVGFVFMEDLMKVFFSLRPGYEDMAEEMVEYAETWMPDFDGGRELVLFSGQTVLIEVIRRRGYTMAGEYVDLGFDLSTGKLEYDLPKGFHFVDPLRADPVKLAECTWKGFDHEDEGPFTGWTARDTGTEWNPQKAYNGMLSALIAPPPHGTPEYNVIIANEREEYVCFSGMWWVRENGLAYMAPLCTIPEYRKLGLAAAALSQHYRRLGPLGAKRMTGGGDAFYEKIGYNVPIRWQYWKKA